MSTWGSKKSTEACVEAFMRRRVNNKLEIDNTRLLRPAGANPAIQSQRKK